MLKPVAAMTDAEVERCPAQQEAGFGSLTSQRGPLPLKAMDIRSRIDGIIAHTTVQQTFVNVHDVPLEATYIFPLPDRAAVTRFRLEVAGRVIEGQLKERGAARREYQQAIQQGHRASIAEEERPGVFTLRVGNLPPGEAVRVTLTLAGPLPYSDGEATFRFPLVVAPRYIPGTPLPGPSVGDGTAADTDAVPDASRITPPVLLPGFPNPVQLSLRVDFSPSLQPFDLRSSLHSVVEESAFPIKRVSLHPGERLNRDFILRFRLAEERIRTSLTLQPDAEGHEGTFLLTLVPPAQAQESVRPRDVVFVLDRSGSMEGWKLVAARRALARMVETLTDRDRFTMIAFDSGFELPGAFAGKLVSGSDRHRVQALEFLARVRSQGGTEMAEPLARAVNLLTGASTAVRERILVLLTDGQVGNEDQILNHLGTKARKVRIFTLGIDQAVNAGFLRRLSDLGGGASELVESEQRLDEVMDQVHRLIGTPILTGLKLEPAGLKVIPGSVVPGRLPDLFAGVPLLILGRYQGSSEGGVSLQGRESAGGMWQSRVAASGETSPAIASVWARARLRELEDRYAIDTANRALLEKEIVGLSLKHGVLCRFTSFVAVDRTEVVNRGGKVRSLVQPVEHPEGWAQTQAAAGGPASAAAGPQQLRKRKASPAPGQPAFRTPTSAPRTTPTESDILICQQILSPEQAADAQRIAQQTGAKVSEVLVQMRYATPEQVIAALAESYGMRSVTLTNVTVPQAVVELVPESVARENVVVPISLDQGILQVALSDPSDLETVEKLQFILNKDIQPVLASRDQIVEAINRHYGESETESVDSMLSEFTDTAIDFTQTEWPSSAIPGTDGQQDRIIGAPLGFVSSDEAGADSDSEFELSREDPSDANRYRVGLEETVDASSYFEETDFDVPMLDDMDEAAEDFDDNDLDLEGVDFGDEDHGEGSHFEVEMEVEPNEAAGLRQETQELLQALRSCPTSDAKHRLQLLRQWMDQLDRIYLALRNWEDPEPVIERLGRAVEGWKGLLSQSQPPRAKVIAVWVELEAALVEYLSNSPGTQAREEFWK